MRPTSLSSARRRRPLMTGGRLRRTGYDVARRSNLPSRRTSGLPWEAMTRLVTRQVDERPIDSSNTLVWARRSWASVRSAGVTAAAWAFGLIVVAALLIATMRGQLPGLVAGLLAVGIAAVTTAAGVGAFENKRRIRTPRPTSPSEDV